MEVAALRRGRSAMSGGSAGRPGRRAMTTSKASPVGVTVAKT
jgi:hypothetical protein